jgi:hypothetical protein
MRRHLEARHIRVGDVLSTTGEAVTQKTTKGSQVDLVLRGRDQKTRLASYEVGERVYVEI